MENLKQFTQYLKDSLSASDFENLHLYLGISGYRLTTLLTGQEDWRLEEIKKLATKLNVAPFELIMEFEVGYKYLTGLELKKIGSEQGHNLGWFVHAA